MSGKHVLFQIHAQDNVATLLDDARQGDLLEHRGEGQDMFLQAWQETAAGHKIALRPIPLGDSIIKYGVAIGIATAAIRPGEWVHLHNCKSRYDARSSLLDLNSGVPTETRYE
ncbi:MAG: UxaA family hydrolase [Acidobacteriota bacterium]